MWNLIIHWLISAASLVIAAYLIPGIQLQGIGPALIAPIVIGLINATIGFIVKIVTFPITIISLGIFLLVINALMLMFAAYLVPGFAVAGFWSAFFGAIVLSIVSMILHSIFA
jgi:putative membrane protein